GGNVGSSSPVLGSVTGVLFLFFLSTIFFDVTGIPNASMCFLSLHDLAASIASSRESYRLIGNLFSSTGSPLSILTSIELALTVMYFIRLPFLFFYQIEDYIYYIIMCRS